MKLKNWSVITDVDPEFVAPEQMHYHLQGNVYGNPSFEDGTFVHTSRIVDVNDKIDHKEVTTKSGSVYKLYKNEVCGEARKRFPNYYDRFESR